MACRSGLCPDWCPGVFVTGEWALSGVSTVSATDLDRGVPALRDHCSVDSVVIGSRETKLELVSVERLADGAAES